MRIILNKSMNESVEFNFAEFLEKDSERAKFSDIYLVTAGANSYILKCPKESPGDGGVYWGDEKWRALYSNEFARMHEIESANVARPMYVCSDIKVYAEGMPFKEYTCGLLQPNIGGQSLEARKNNRIDKATACQMSVQIIDAVNHVNTKGLYHLDISENNIKVSSRDNIVVIDFTGGFSPETQTELIMSSRIEGKIRALRMNRALTKEHCIRAQAYMVFKILMSICTVDEDMEKIYGSFDPERGPTLSDLKNAIENFMNK